MYFKLLPKLVVAVGVRAEYARWRIRNRTDRWSPDIYGRH